MACHLFGTKESFSEPMQTHCPIGPSATNEDFGIRTRPWFNIKILSSYQYRKSHCGDKTILRPSYLHNGISYTDKMTSLCWIRAQVAWAWISNYMLQNTVGCNCFPMPMITTSDTVFKFHWNFSLHWRHNERDCVSNHQPHDCLLSRLLRRRSKKTSKLYITGLCAGINWWIPRTNGQWRGKCFHLMTSSCLKRLPLWGVLGVLQFTVNTYFQSFAKKLDVV